MSFYHRRNVNMPKFSRLLQEEIKQLNTETQLKFDSSILGAQSLSWRPPVSFDKCSRSTHNFANFTRERNRTFTKICGSPPKINQQEWSLVCVKKRHCCCCLAANLCENFNPVKSCIKYMRKIQVGLYFFWPVCYSYAAFYVLFT